MQRLLSVFERLNMPVALEKLEGTAVRLSLLGIEMDTEAMTLKLPHRKLMELVVGSGMDGQEVMHKEGPAITSWKAPTCVQGSAPRQDIQRGEQEAALYPAQRGLPV